MRIALMSAKMGDTYDAQITQVKQYLADYLSVDILCFGNQFLMGKQQLTGNYETDLSLALDITSKEILLMRGLAKKYRVGLGFGFVEKEDNAFLYNSYVILDKEGQILHLHRSCATNWIPEGGDEHYRVGDTHGVFEIRGLKLAIASFGDLEYMDNIVKLNEISPDAVIWPITLKFNPTEWRNEGLNDLANQLKILKPSVLLVNSFSEDDSASGGAYLFTDGNVIKELPLGNMGILIVSDAELRN